MKSIDSLKQTAMQEEAMALELGERTYDEGETLDSREAAWLRAQAPGSGQNCWAHPGIEAEGTAPNRETGGKSL